LGTLKSLLESGRSQLGVNNSGREPIQIGNPSH
jgi:hypothetical protein